MIEIDRKIPDYLGSYKDSIQLARAIRRYWRNRGQEPKVFVESFTLGSTDTEYFQIRSDINLTTEG